YNTYTRTGLPMGPINNPGLETIEAALYPEESPYLFYLHDSAGQVHYGKNFEEHKRNKALYLR
ncbi:endolytic transglycosylase MltG, partial [Staphylococcus aureus]|uniref:endolytic transglycosylase MltG n=1 Tax=Staphylococcus aureus TaxID=1280 RepID=UPI001E3CE3CA